MLGDAERSPRITEVLDLLEQPHQNVVVNFLGVALQDRPAFFAELLPILQEMRSRTSRPHWIVVDETWLYHLQQQDYSRWFQEAIKDDSLAQEAAEIEKNAYTSATESRTAIKQPIEQRYTLPA